MHNSSRYDTVRHMRGLVICFGYQNVNPNLSTLVVDVYQVIFSVFGVFHSPLSILFKKLHDTNKYFTVPQVDKYVHHILVKFQFTIFCHIHTRGIFTKQACFVVHQRNYVDLHSFILTYC